MRPSPPDKPRHAAAAAFTLIELTLVLALLAIVAALTAPQMVVFFRGRALNEEARRVLALTHYAQSRAVAEGVPVVAWFDPAKSVYGQHIEAGYVNQDAQASSFSVESSLTLEAPVTTTAPATEPGDEGPSQTADLPVIRFTPDGYYDYSSLPKLVLRQGTEAALELVPTANRLGYEILPHAIN